MKLALTADLHGYLPEIPECDLLIIAGDVTPVWNHDRGFQAIWLKSDFSDWLRSVPAKHIVGIGGNHDYVLERAPGTTFSLGYNLPWTYLHNETAVIEGKTIYGSPYSNRFGNWAFMKWERELKEMYEAIPRDIDILITHGPPYSYGDLVGERYRRDGQDPHVGSVSLQRQLEGEEWPNLRLHVFGHIHEGHGAYSLLSKNAAPGPMLVNASHMTGDYQPTNPVIQVVLPDKWGNA